MPTSSFWDFFDQLIAQSRIIIDRPKDTHHPRYPEIIYPLDYGYLEHTASPDGVEIDLWRGSQTSPTLQAILVTVDMVKRDSEIKLLLGCTQDETSTVLQFHNLGAMRAEIIYRPTKE